jgi:hypothetical protein
MPFRNTFSYDPLGNRLAKTESGVRTTYAYDAANQLRYDGAARLVQMQLGHLRYAANDGNGG